MTILPYRAGPDTIAPILVVEDDPGIRALIMAILDEEGFNAAAVEDGQQAIAWLQAERPAMVILDLQLPKVPGEGVLRELIALYGGAVPVITMTAQILREDVMRQSGAWAHLKKPFMLDELLGAIAVYL